MKTIASHAKQTTFEVITENAVANFIVYKGQNMPHIEAMMTLDPLKIFEQPTMTPFVKECLTDPDKNIRAGLFCAFMSYAVNRTDVPTALQNCFSQQQYLFKAKAFTSTQARELAMAQHGSKVEVKKCQTCHTVFLTATGTKSKAHCSEHHTEDESM